jgi:hypothetical protein
LDDTNFATIDRSVIYVFSNKNLVAPWCALMRAPTAARGASTFSAAVARIGAIRATRDR